MRPKVFSAYLAAIVVWQIAIYIYSGFADDAGWLIYFDPRIGLEMFREVMGDRTHPAWYQWASAIILLILAGAVFKNERAIIVYLAVEPVLALPTLSFFFMVLHANMSAAHGFSVPELTIPTAVLVVCTVIPWTWAVMLFRSGVGRSAW